MRTITPDPARQVPASAPATRRRTTVSTDALIETIVGDLHEMIGSLRCAGTGRMVKAGISMTHLHILWVLEHHGDLTMSRLADLLDAVVDEIGPDHLGDHVHHASTAPQA